MLHRSAVVATAVLVASAVAFTLGSQWMFWVVWLFAAWTQYAYHRVGLDFWTVAAQSERLAVLAQQAITGAMLGDDAGDDGNVH
jgi:multidrug resistance efflux pump